MLKIIFMKGETETHVNQFTKISFKGDYNQLYSVHGKCERLLLIKRNLFLTYCCSCCCCFCVYLTYEFLIFLLNCLLKTQI